MPNDASLELSMFMERWKRSITMHGPVAAAPLSIFLLQMSSCTYFLYLLTCTSLIAVQALPSGGALGTASKQTQSNQDEPQVLSTLFTFEEDSIDGLWTLTTDGVMQDRPKAELSFNKGIMTFGGEASQEVATTPSARAAVKQLGLKNNEFFALRVKGDGREYGFEILTSANFRGRPVRFRALFPTKKDWHTIAISPKDMKPLIYGRQLGNIEPRLDEIIGIGIVAADQTPGNFSLRVGSISIAKELDD